MQFLRDLRPALLAFAPWTAAILTLAAGDVLVIEKLKDAPVTP